jgi:ATP-binding cassette subfamily B protein
MSNFTLAVLLQVPKTTRFHQYRGLLMRYLKPQTPRVILMAALLLAGIALQLVNPQIIRYFLDTAQKSAGARPLMIAGVLFITFAILQQAMTLAADYTSKAVGWTATIQLRADLALHCLRLDMPFHKSRTPGEMIDRIEGDVNQLGNFFSQFNIRVLGDGLLILGILTLLFLQDIWIGLGMLVYTALTLLVLRYIQNLAVPRWAAERQAGAILYGYIEERISGAEEIRAAGAEAYAMRRLYALMRTFTDKTRAAAVVSSLTFNLTNLVYIIGYSAGLALGVYLYTRGQASLGTAYLVTYYIGMLSGPLQSIRAQVEDLQQASANIQRIQELFDLKPQVGNPSGASLPLPAGPLSVEFDDVTFRYEDDQANGNHLNGNGLAEGHVLNHITFSIQPGRVLGILGRTGSGKSTMTRLLFRLYDPNQGAVKLGGVDLRHVSLADLRQQVSMVTQDVQLFQATVRENLTFFNPAIPDSQLEQILKSLRLWEWVQSLPKGLETPLARGESLSAGEAQLLAFARVFLKNPGLIILDEASSRLDPSTEALMERTVDFLFTERTGVVIAHRLKTVQRADDILILEDGCVVEYGPRQELAANPFSRFYHLLQTGLEEALV